MGISLFLHIDRNFGTRVPNKLGSVSHNITVMAPGYLEKGLCQARFGTQVKLGNLTRTSPPLPKCSQNEPSQSHLQHIKILARIIQMRNGEEMGSNGQI
jgi:hypothetical protein